MEEIKIHARILCNSIVGQTAYFQIQIRGLEFKDHKTPSDYPVQTLAVEEEILIHFGNRDEMSEQEIAVIVPNRIVTINALRDEDNNIVIKSIKPDRMNISLGEHISLLEKLH